MSVTVGSPTFSRQFESVERRRARAMVALRIGDRSVTLIEKFVQLDMFPVTGEVEALDPRTVIGPATRVSGLYRVRYGGAASVHQVYHDRHGWYCGEHGPGCVAVSDAVATARAR